VTLHFCRHDEQPIQRNPVCPLQAKLADLQNSCYLLVAYKSARP